MDGSAPIIPYESRLPPTGDTDLHGMLMFVQTCIIVLGAIASCYIQTHNYTGLMLRLSQVPSLCLQVGFSFAAISTWIDSANASVEHNRSRGLPWLLFIACSIAIAIAIGFQPSVHYRYSAHESVW